MERGEKLGAGLGVWHFAQYDRIATISNMGFDSVNRGL
jgi:hypothetical protein